MSKKTQAAIDAKTPDAFLTTSDKLLNWVEHNRALVGTVLGVLLVGGIGWVAYGQWNGMTERKAAAAMYSVEAKIRAKREEYARKEDERLQNIAKQNEAKNGKSKEPVKPVSTETVKPNFEKDFASLAQDLEKEIQNHKNTNAAAVSTLNLVGLYLSNKKAELADALLAKVDHAKDESLTALLKTQKATVAMELGDYTRAASGFEAITQDRKAEFLHPDALLKLGVCQEKLGQTDQAKGTFERVSTEFGDSEAGRSAKAYLRLLQLEGPSKPSTESKG